MGPIMKQYQEEIDKLTKRAKSCEVAFTTLYKKARRAPPCRARAIPACPALCARWGTSVWA